MRIFLDTNICIYFLQGRKPQLKLKFQLFKPSDIKIPSIVKAELLLGAEKSERREFNLARINEFLFPYTIVPFDTSAAEEYAVIRSALEKKCTTIGANDYIIAATVLADNGLLVTNNTGDFRRVPRLKLDDWTNE